MSYTKSNLQNVVYNEQKRHLTTKILNIMKFNNPESVLICAFLYALGRRTYVVSEIVNEIVLNWNQLSKKSKDLIAKEISECDDLGMDMDKKEWMKVLNLYN